MKYVYGIIKNQPNQKSIPALNTRGMQEKAIETVVGKGVSALVSETKCKKMSLKKENIIVHDAVLKEAMIVYRGILPVSFGTIVAETELKKGLLLPKDKDLLKMLKKVEGKVEVNIKGFWSDFKALIRRLREKDPVVSSLELPEHPTYFETVEIGKALEGALNRQRDEYREELTKSVKNSADDIKEKPLIADKMIFNLALLINGESEKKLQQKVKEFKQRHAEELMVWYSGPVPPFHFVSWKK